MTPTFMGAEPTIAPDGTDYAGLFVLITEQDKGLAMINALSADQQAVAIIATAKAGADMKGGADSDNAVIPYEGIVATDLDADQQHQLIDLIAEWIGNMPDDQAGVKMEEIEAHLDETSFAWIGDTGAGAVFHYRIQSPVILIEFDHQEPGPLGRASDYYQGATGPQRAHIDSVVRTPNGNDYGKDLLADHYATSPHHAGTPEATPGATPVTGAALIGGIGAAEALSSMLPPRYRNGAIVSNAPMGSAELEYDAGGKVAWNRMWDDFCDLALAGGPSHRATILDAPSADGVWADGERQAWVVAEITRGLEMITGWESRAALTSGWVELVCPDTDAARWMEQAIRAENVMVAREDHVLALPAGPAFELKHEIRNVVTAVAKTHHYWTEHAFAIR